MSNHQNKKDPSKEAQNDSDTDSEASKETDNTSEIDSVTKAFKKLSLLPTNHVRDCEGDAADSYMPSTSEVPLITRLTSRNMVTVSFSRLANGFCKLRRNDTPSSSQSLESCSNVPTDIIERKVTSLVRLMLLKYQRKEPITKEEMIQTVIKNHEKHFNEIFCKAHKRMEMIFGLDVKEVDHTNHCYVFIISLGLTFDGLNCGKEGIPKSGLLILILGIIFMKDNSATEQEIWDILNQIGIYANEHHFVFGDTKDLLTYYFVRENYLIYRQMANNSGCFEFLWGARAHSETSKMKVLEFIAMVNGSVPCDFGYKYEEALQEEMERGMANNMAWASTSSDSLDGLS